MVAADGSPRHSSPGHRRDRQLARLLCAAAVAIGTVSAGAAGAADHDVPTQRLFDAIAEGDMPAVKAAVADGADLEARNDEESTPFERAIQGAHFGIAHYLHYVANDGEVPPPDQVTEAAAGESDTSPAASDGQDDTGPDLFGWLGRMINPPSPAAADAPPTASGNTPPTSGEAAAPAAPEQASLPDSVPADPPATTGDPVEGPLSVGSNIGLDRAAPFAGRPPPGVSEPPCVSKVRDTVLFCVEPVDWPDDLAPRLWVVSPMYQGNQAIVRYDNGEATFVHALIPAPSFDAAIGHYTRRLGPPSSLWDRHVTLLGGAREPNPAVVWRGPPGADGSSRVLEIRRFDDTRGGFPDTDRGAIMLYRDGAEPIFPRLSSMELMTFRITEGTAPPGALLPGEQALPSAASGTPPPAVESPPQAAARLAPPPPAEAAVPALAEPRVPGLAGPDPFDPASQVTPSLSRGTVEGPEPDSRGTVEGAAAGPDSPDQGTEIAPPPGFFTRLARTFDGGTAEQDTTPVKTGVILDGVVLSVGGGYGLGVPAPAGTTAAAPARDCVAAIGGGGLVCRRDLEWPDDIATAFAMDTLSNTITDTATIRFDGGRSSRIQQPFPSDSFERIMGHFRARFGPPTRIRTATDVNDAADDRDIDEASWQSLVSPEMPPTVLQVQRLDAAASAESGRRLGSVRLFLRDSRTVETTRR